MKKILSFFVLAGLLWQTATFVQAAETTVYLDTDPIITIVNVDDDNEIVILLREFAEMAGYAVRWDENGQCINLQKEGEVIVITPGQGSCLINGAPTPLDKPVFIEEGKARLPQSLLETIFHIEIVQIDQDAPFRRVNGVYLSRGELLAVHCEAFNITIQNDGSLDLPKTLQIDFSLGIRQSDIFVSMDYKLFLLANEDKVADVVTDMVKEASRLDFEDADQWAALKQSLVDGINEALDVSFVKEFYINELFWQD